MVEDAVAEASRKAQAQGIAGKDLTPFLLARISELTGEASLKANRELVFSSARVAAAIAVSLHAPDRGTNPWQPDRDCRGLRGNRESFAHRNIRSGMRLNSGSSRSAPVHRFPVARKGRPGPQGAQDLNAIWSWHGAGTRG